MTQPLSPAAQAVWDAFNEDEAGVFVDYGDKLAAALRAAAKIVAPEAAPHRRKIRAELLDLATELEATDD